MKRSDKPSGMTATGKTREAVIVFFEAVIERWFSARARRRNRWVSLRAPARRSR